MKALWKKINRFIYLDMIWYFSPLIALVRMIRKRRLNYIHQMRVLSRYCYGR
jgi:hypothetical protein